MAAAQHMTEFEIRAELVKVLDQLSALPNDAFPERVALRDRQAALRSALTELHGPALTDQQAQWDAQAASKRPKDEGDISGTIASPNEAAGGI